MTTGSIVRHLFIAASLVLTGAMTGQSMAYAQDGPEFEPGFYETVMTGEEIEVSGDRFHISNVLRQNYPDGENEQVFIDGTGDSELPAILEISYLDDSDTPDQTIELWVSGLANAEGIDGLEVADAGLDGDVYWYYVTGSLDDLGIVFYIQVTEDVTGNIDMLESVLAIEGSLVDVVGAAQGDISIGGDAFMDDVDLDDLEGLANGEPFRDGMDDPGTPDDNDDDSGGRNDEDDDSGGDDDDDQGD